MMGADVTQTLTHERIVAALIGILTDWSWASDEGMVLASRYKVHVRARGGVLPDVQFYRRGNLPVGQEQGLERGRPDLAIEVLSPGSKSRDRVRRLQEYAALGVPEYWVVDPEDRTLERLVLRVRPGAGRVFTIAEALAGDATFRPASFYGLEIDLGRLW